ncbi:MAG: hypothetical protein ACTS44_01420 [Candidatus Hodgkinia cicadicola]
MVWYFVLPRLRSSFGLLTSRLLNLFPKVQLIAIFGNKYFPFCQFHFHFRRYAFIV